jgi:hypothetical protein
MPLMFVALFIETGADDLLTGKQDKRRRVYEARRARNGLGSSGSPLSSSARQGTAA